MSQEPSPEETATRAWLEALVAAGWTVSHRWWPEDGPSTAKGNTAAEVSAAMHVDQLTVDEAIDLMREPIVRSYEFTAAGASFSICGWGLAGGGR